MKKIIAAVTLVLLSFMSFAQNQELPTTKVRDLNGKQISFNEAFEKGKVTMVSFWATWCKPCIQELQTYHGLFDEWKTKYGAKLIAVSIDDSRNAQKVAPFIKSRNWQYDVLLDINQDFKRAMNVNNVPHTFIIMNGKVVFSHAAYTPGDEEELEELLKKLSGKE